MSGIKPLISVDPEELRFQFQLEKQSYCDLKVSNNNEHHVAFKVKTTSPKKYFVRPNTGVIHPWDSCVIRVTLQAQREYPPDMQCKDKFLLQSTVVAPNSDVDDLPQDTFNKDSGKAVEECKLRVVYLSPHLAKGTTDDEAFRSSKRSLDTVQGDSNDENQVLQRLKEERDVVAKQTQQLQQELDMLKRRRQRTSNRGFSFKFALLVALIGIMLGFLLKLSLSSPALDSE
ncbi:Vesicle-associated protein 2-1 [Ancistrocladus abbreviatus]